MGQIYPLTKYQAGCRFLQKKLEEQPDQQHVTLVFNEVFDHLIELMTDPYGQYLVPKLMKHCDKAQRQAIVTKIAPKIVTFACHTYGIHGVQKILEYLTDEQVLYFISYNISSGETNFETGASLHRCDKTIHCSTV